MSNGEAERQRALTPGVNGLLRNKVALITGASRGIGAAAARAFAEAGAAVVLAARDERSLAAVAQDIQETGGRALAVPTDVGDPGAVERLIARIVDAYGRLDVAFNNAGTGHMPAPLAGISVEAFDETIRGTLRGIFLCMQHEIPAMLAAGSGAIVNMSSTAGVRGVPGMAAYAAAKHGIIGLTASAALDYAARNIRVNAIAPGPIASDRIANLNDTAREQIANHVPMRRVGHVEEVAATVVWLCSDRATFITGATIPMDGGRLAAGA